MLTASEIAPAPDEIAAELIVPASAAPTAEFAPVAIGPASSAIAAGWFSPEAAPAIAPLAFAAVSAPTSPATEAAPVWSQTEAALVWSAIVAEQIGSQIATELASSAVVLAPDAPVSALAQRCRLSVAQPAPYFVAARPEAHDPLQSALTPLQPQAVRHSD